MNTRNEVLQFMAFFKLSEYIKGFVSVISHGIYGSVYRIKLINFTQKNSIISSRHSDKYHFNPNYQLCNGDILGTGSACGKQ